MRHFDLDLDGLTILFIYLKLTGHVQWHWWVIVLPTILSVGLQIFYRNEKR